MKFYDLIKESVSFKSNTLFTPRRVEKRVQDKINIFNQRIASYKGGDLELSMAPEGTIIPDNFTVDGTLYLNHARIDSLPKNLHVKGNLILRLSNIYYLPEDLVVDKVLYLSAWLKIVLPKTAKVGLATSVGGNYPIFEGRRLIKFSADETIDRVQPSASFGNPFDYFLIHGDINEAVKEINLQFMKNIEEDIGGGFNHMDYEEVFNISYIDELKDVFFSKMGEFLTIYVGNECPFFESIIKSKNTLTPEVTRFYKLLYPLQELVN